MICVDQNNLPILKCLKWSGKLKAILVGFLSLFNPCIYLLFFYLFFFWPCRTACGILVPRPGTEPRPQAVRAQNPNPGPPGNSWFSLFRMAFHWGNSVLKSSLIRTVMQVLQWMAKEISVVASPPKNVIFRNFCSFAPLCHLWGFMAVLGIPPTNHRVNILILGQLLISVCWGSRV